MPLRLTTGRWPEVGPFMAGPEARLVATQGPRNRLYSGWKSMPCPLSKSTTRRFHGPSGDQTRETAS